MSNLGRRTFLRRLGFGTVAAAAAATSLYDVERLLWVPGERTIFIPVVPRSYLEALDASLRYEARILLDLLPHIYFRGLV